MTRPLKTHSIIILTFIYLCGSWSTKAFGCDLCSIYSSVESQNPIAGSFHLGIAQQFTGYDKIQDDGHKIENTAHQHLESSITQLFALYDYQSNLSFQFSLPYINRRFTRVHDDEIDKGTEAGIGDSSLIAKYQPYRYSDGTTDVVVQLLGGIKLPTGSSDRLEEELHEHEESPDEIAGAVHGHDLALGSGSYDVPLGASFFAHSGRYFISSEAQYTIRTKGDHSYRYSNDLLWNVAPGYYVPISHETTLATKAVLSGDYKAQDTGHEGKEDDTYINTLFLGPEFTLTSSERTTVDFGIDFPLNIQNSGVQAVASYKLRAAVSYRF